MAEAYIQVDGIKGSSIDPDHKDWIEVQSYKHNFSQPINNAQAGTSGRRAQGRALWEEFIITKQQDSASPELAHLCAAGNHIKKVEIKLMAAGASGKDKRNNYMKITMEDVYISKFESRLDPPKANGEGHRPVEDIHFNFGKIKWQFTPDRVGQAASPIIKGWNRDENKDNS
jgi:type VI secretion system secreted protein Hcp